MAAESFNKLIEDMMEATLQKGAAGNTNFNNFFEPHNLLPDAAVLLTQGTYS